MNGLLAVVYLCMFGSIVAFTAYVWLLQNVRPALAASYAYVNPVIAVLLGTLIGHEHFGPHDLAGHGGDPGRRAGADPGTDP
jgi:drug/metabolite transporter (DMT)-like permease